MTLYIHIKEKSRSAITAKLSRIIKGRARVYLYNNNSNYVGMVELGDGEKL